ncbi:MAG: hypothetical protein ACHWZW_09920 [Spirulina sp.]
MEDDLRPEYDLKSLRVRKLGSGRKNAAGATVKSESNHAEMFPVAKKEARPLEEVMEEISQKVQERGLTPEILGSILSEP